MATKKELSVVLPNKPGTLAAVTAALAKAKVNLLAVDASGGFEYNIIKLVPKDVAEKHQCIGDVRGVGLMVGVEFVKSRITREPAPELVHHLARILLEAVRDDDFSAARFAPVERLQQGLIEHYDVLYRGAYAATRSFQMITPRKKPGTGLGHRDHCPARLRSIELLGKEVIPALHEIKLQPYEEASAGAVSHR